MLRREYICRRAFILGLICVVGLFPGSFLAAQDRILPEAGVLVIDTDRLFAETILGQRLRKRYEDQRAQLIEVNREIEKQLEAEEKELTDKRSQLTPDGFRVLADAFDEKVEKIRRGNEAVALELEHQRERDPILFLQHIKPALSELMQETGAVAILEARTVLLRLDTIDATDRAIEKVNQIIGRDDPLPE